MTEFLAVVVLMVNMIGHMRFFSEKQLPPLSKSHLLRSIKGLPIIP
jgi:hypothetical protein